MNREKEIVKTSIIGIFGNILLVIGKILVGVIASSISIIMDGINNLTDAMSSTITIIGTKLANKKPNKKHPFGYGRIEYITSSLIGAIIFVAGFMAIYESIKSLIDLSSGEKPSYDVFSFVIIGLAIGIKIFLGLYFRYKGKEVDSDALRASGMDALLDVLLSVGTLVGAIISTLFNIYLEGYIGIAIGLFIIKTSFEVFKESVSKLIGVREDKEYTSKITADIYKVNEVKGVYDLIINNYGNDRNIGSVHVEVRDDMTAKEIQALEKEIGFICLTNYNIIMTVGIYAENNDKDAQNIKDNILNIVSSYKEVLQTHGFFIDIDKKIITLDIVFDFEAKNQKEIYDEIYSRITEQYPEYKFEIIIDHDFNIS